MINYLKKTFYFFIISIIFLLLACLNIEKPTPDWEEVILSSPAISILNNKPISSQFTTVQIAGRRWPIMEIGWIGAIESYLMLPIYRIFGVSIRTLRIAEISLSLVIALLFGYLSFIMFNERVSKAATILILFNATYLLHGRVGFTGVILVLWAACVLSLIFFWKWVKSKKNYWLYFSAFSMGMGAYGKLHFIGLAAGIVFGWIILIRPQAKSPGVAKVIIKAALAFTLGFSPYIIENIRTRGFEIGQLIYLFLHPIDGSTNLEYLKHLGIRLNQIIWAIQGASNYYNEYLLAKWLKLLLLVPIVALLLPKVRKNLGDQKKPLFFLGICILFFVLGASFKGTQLGSVHVFVVLPLIAICSAVMLSVLLKNKYCFIFVVPIILIADLFVIGKYYLRLGATRENKIIEMSDFLLSQNAYTPIIVNNWRLAAVINIISGGKVFPLEGGSIKENEYQEYIKDRERIYILRQALNPHNENVDSEGWLRFNQALQKNRRTIFPLKEYSIDGNTVSLCRIK
jgi:hypothetical protein